MNETWLNHDVTHAVQVQYLDGNLFSQDNAGNLIGVNLTRDGEPFAASGSVSASVIRSDGATVAVSGALSGNVATIVLPSAAYTVPGVVSIVIKLTSDGEVATIAALVANVYKSSTDTVVDPGTIIPSIADLIDAIDDAVESIPQDYSTLSNNAVNLLSSSATAIQAYSDMDSLTTPGNYYVANASTAANISHYPFSIGGRVLVGQTSNAATLIQIAFANSGSSVKWRMKVSTWTDWVTIATKESIVNYALMGTGLVTGSPGLSDLDNAGVNTIIGYTASDITNLSHFPESIHGGGLIITLNHSNILNGRIQFVIQWTNSFVIATRYYANSTWSAWGSTGGNVTTIHCGTGQTYTNLVDVLDYVTSDTLRNTWSESNRLVIQLDAGEYPMDKIATLYGNDSTRYKWGVYVPRYCTIKGAGKDKTFLTYNYSGSDDWILGHLSPLNMPYESALEDLTISAQNCRYCVHSDGDEPFNRSWALIDNKITVKNVKMIHSGYTGTPPTYNVPSAWGAGLRDNVSREFINCEFVAKHMPWFTHNTTGATKPSEVIFRNCRFVNTKDAAFSSAGEFAGATFISWGTNVINHVSFFDCYSNRYISIRPSVTYNEDTTCDYFVYDDGTNFVVEEKTNDAHLLDTWINRNCIVANATQSITGYAPISVDENGNASAYSTTSFAHGIALNSCSASESVTVQTKGLIDLRKPNISGFTSGALVGWNGSAWVADNTNPIIKIISSYVGQIV